MLPLSTHLFSHWSILLTHLQYDVKTHVLNNCATNFAGFGVASQQSNYGLLWGGGGGEGEWERRGFPRLLYTRGGGGGGPKKDFKFSKLANAGKKKTR